MRYIKMLCPKPNRNNNLYTAIALFILIFFMCSIWQPLLTGRAEPTPNSPAKKTKNVNPESKGKLDKINHQIQEISDKIEKLQKEEKSILNEIYNVELKYEKAVIVNNKLKLQLRNVGDQIDKRSTEKAKLQKDIDKSKRNLKKIVRILYKIGGNQYLKLFLRIDNLDQLFANYRNFIALINYKTEELTKLRINIERLSIVNRELNERFTKLRDLQQSKEKKVRDIHRLKRSKIDIMKNIAGNRSKYRQLLDELENEAARLNEIIYGKKVKRRFGVIDLTKIKGRLTWPIKGKVISRFGKKRSTRFNTYILENGIKIRPTGSDKVTAVYPGEIVFADYYKGYGKLVIIQHAKNLYTLYGHCENILKKKGDSVGKGDVISIAGSTGSVTGKSLYFEIRTHADPQDPLKWLRRR
jgi:murein hydrolase activator